MSEYRERVKAMNTKDGGSNNGAKPRDERETSQTPGAMTYMHAKEMNDKQ